MPERCYGYSKATILKNELQQLTGRSRTDILVAAIKYTTTATTIRPPNAPRNQADYIAFKKAQLLSISKPEKIVPQQSIIITQLQEFGAAQLALECQTVT
jgi:hypothetical protein